MTTERRLTVLFVDIADSTRIYDRLGDTRGRARILDCLDLLASEVEAAGGVVVERIGDELMCRFDEAQGALAAATAMQVRLERRRESDAGADVHVRIGLHAGPVLCTDTGLSGETVHVANRMVNLAKAGQVVVAKETLLEVPIESRPSVRFLERASVKGKDGAYELFEVLWGSEFTVQLSEGGGRTPSSVPELELTCGDETLRLGEACTEATIGRVGSAVLRIDAASVSRLHARIELRKRSFVLVDLSTNGTRVEPEGGGQLFLRREELPLRGAGRIIAGPGDPDAERLPIAFRCLT